jgi:hypothetical protein
MTDPVQRELADFWRKRMETAAERYRTAKRLSKEAEWTRTDAPPPDGDLAFRKALQAETAALAEYRRVMVSFTDLLLYGKLPPQE